MPSGRTHLAINTCCGAALAGLLDLSGTLALTSPGGLALAAGFLLGSVWITPDLDMKGVRTAPLRAWGPLGFIWSPLLAVTRHRGVSHTFLRGPALRLLYLAAALGALWACTAGLLSALTLGVPRVDLPAWAGPAMPFVLGGYLAAQWLHLLADRVPPALRNL